MPFGRTLQTSHQIAQIACSACSNLIEILFSFLPRFIWLNLQRQPRPRKRNTMIFKSVGLQVNETFNNTFTTKPCTQSNAHRDGCLWLFDHEYNDNGCTGNGLQHTKYKMCPLEIASNRICSHFAGVNGVVKVLQHDRKSIACNFHLPYTIVKWLLRLSYVP